jgi:hypothetical protein
LSEYTIMERYLGIEQPSDEEERKMIEQATRHPIMIQYMLMHELKKRADSGDQVATLVMQQIQQGQIQGPGQPPAGPNPEQLTGLQSPTGQPVPQAVGQPPPGQSAQEQMSAMSNAAPNMAGMVG